MLHDLLNNWTDYVPNSPSITAQYWTAGAFIAAFAMLLTVSAILDQLRQSPMDSDDAGDGAADPYLQSLFHETDV